MAHLFTLFISESIALWAWAISIPAGIAIAVALVSTPFLIHGQALRFYFGFRRSLAVMAALGIINTKRLLCSILAAQRCTYPISPRNGFRKTLAKTLHRLLKQTSFVVRNRSYPPRASCPRSRLMARRVLWCSTSRIARHVPGGAVADLSHSNPSTTYKLPKIRIVLYE